MSNLTQILGSVGLLGVLAVILGIIFKKGSNKNETSTTKSPVTNPDAPYTPSDKLQEHIDDTVKQSTESAVESARKATESNLEQIRQSATRQRDSRGRFIKSE